MYIDPMAQIPTHPSWNPPSAERRSDERAERHRVDLLVRYAWKGLRATVMLKDLTRFGARIEGIEALRTGDGLTLLLPELPASEATVAWAMGRSAGLVFETPLEEGVLAALVRDFAPVKGKPFTPECLAVSLPAPQARAA